MRDRPAPEHFATSQRPEPSPHPQGRVDGTRPARPDGEVGLHAARRLDAQPHRGSGLRGTQASVPAFPGDERDVSAHQVPDVREIHLPKEVVQLASLAPRQRRLEGQECVPRAVLDRHAEQEEAKLELGSGDHERRHRSSRSQIGNLDRQVIVLGHVIADDELIVGVDVHEAPGSRVNAVRVIDARQLFPAREESVPEPQISQDPFEPTSVRAMHEEVQVVLPTRRPIEGLVALPVAVADPRSLE